MLSQALILVISLLVPFVLFRDGKPVRAAAQGTIFAPIDRVFSTLADLRHWHEWNPDVTSMKLDGEVGLGTRFVWKAVGVTIDSTVTEFDPPHRIAWRGRTMGISAEHTWDLEEVQGGVRVRTQEWFRGPLAWLLPKTMRKQLKRACARSVFTLREACESNRQNRHFGVGRAS